MTRLTRTLLILLALAPTSVALAGEKVALPNPWQAGRTFEYATYGVIAERPAKGAGHVRVNSDRSILTITRVDAAGAHQQWRARDSATQLLEGADETQPIAEAVMHALDRSGIDVAVDPRGRYLRLENIDAIATQMRAFVRPAVLGMFEAAQAGAPVDAGKRALVERNIDESMAKSTTPQVIEDVIGHSLRTFNLFIASELETGISQRREIMWLSPGPDSLLPVRLDYVLLPPGDEPGVATIEWKVTPDLPRAREQLWNMHDAATGVTTPAEQREGMPAGFELEENGTLRIDRATGVVLSGAQTHRDRVGGKTKNEQHWMVLVRQDGPGLQPLR